MPSLLLRRSASLDGCSCSGSSSSASSTATCQAGNAEAAEEAHPQRPSASLKRIPTFKERATMGFTRKGSFEPPQSPDILRSDGIDFVMDRPSAPVRSVASPTTKVAKTKKRQPSGADKTRLVGLLPAFAHRTRSESCGGAIDAYVKPYAESHQTPPQLSKHVESPETPTPNGKIARPRLLRKASSAGDLTDLATKPGGVNGIVGLDSTPRATAVAFCPNKRNESLKRGPVIIAPFTPDSAGKPVSKQLSHLNSGVLSPDTPPLTPTPSRKRSSQGISSSASPLRAISERIRMRSRSGTGNGSIPMITTSEHLDTRPSTLPAMAPTHSPSQGQQSHNVDITLGGKTLRADLSSGDAVICVAPNFDDAQLDISCVRVPDALGGEVWQIRLHRRPSAVLSPCVTPMPPNSAAFSPTFSPPSLSCSPTPSPQTALLLTPEPAVFRDQQNLKDDVFWNNPTTSVLPRWSLSTTHEGYDSDEDVQLPPTPKRRGFILPDNFDIKAISPDLRNNTRSPTLGNGGLTSPRSFRPLHCRQAGDDRKSRSRTNTATGRNAFSPTISSHYHPYDRDEQSSPASDEEDGEQSDGEGLEQNNSEWHAYNGFLSDTAESDSATCASSLAKRRLGGAAAKGLRLGIEARPVLTHIKPVNMSSHEAEISRWSETEGEDNDGDSIFSLASS